jgi:hypothetical protein
MRRRQYQHRRASTRRLLEDTVPRSCGSFRNSCAELMIALCETLYQAEDFRGLRNLGRVLIAAFRERFASRCVGLDLDSQASSAPRRVHLGFPRRSNTSRVPGNGRWPSVLRHGVSHPDRTPTCAACPCSAGRLLRVSSYVEGDALSAESSPRMRIYRVSQERLINLSACAESAASSERVPKKL